MTYTINNVPDEIDRAIRARAKAEHKSPEQTILDALARDLGMSTSLQSNRDLNEQNPPLPRDLSGIAGLQLITEEMKAAFDEQRRIDPELWK